MKNIGIIFGGKSPEYRVSLESVTSILNEMNKELYNPILIGVSKEGTWYKFNGDIAKIVEDTWVNHDDCIPCLLSPNPADSKLLVLKQNKIESIVLDAVFPIMHGANGEDGTIQGYIKLSGFPIVGCDVLASALCMDKYRSHQLISNEGIQCAKSHVFNQSTIHLISVYCDEIGYPCFMKPVNAGSSFGISKVNNKTELKQAIDLAFQYDHEIIVEEFINGFEVGCAIIGDKNLIVGRIDEIELSEGFFNFDEKYTLKTSSIHVPARISIEKEEEIKETAKRIYKALGCSGFARVDCFINQKSEIMFNEVNTIPGFTAHSRFPSMLKAIGYTFQEIITMVIEEAFNNEES